jgi:hypothetical protein
MTFYGGILSAVLYLFYHYSALYENSSMQVDNFIFVKFHTEIVLCYTLTNLVLINLISLEP